MAESDRPLAGRGAIITGANQGLGRAIAQAFVHAGASVLLMARDVDLLRQTEKELRASTSPDQKVLICPGDVSVIADCQAAVDMARGQIANLCVLVNNAGIYGPMGPTEEVSFDEWARTIEINLFGTLHMCRSILPHLKAGKYGKIINLSGGGATQPMPRISAYAASKAAVVRLTETLAEELRDWHIDANAVAPGALNTKMLNDVLAAGSEKVGAPFYAKAMKQRDEGGAPPEKGAALAVFLASSASDGITGRLLSAIWDDWQNLAARRDKLAATDVYTLRRIVPRDRGME